MKFKLSLSCLALAACLQAPAALAQSTTGSASISQLIFELIDLNLNDGVAPSLIWGSSSSDASASSFAGTQYTLQGGVVTGVSLGPAGGQTDQHADGSLPVPAANAAFGGSQATVSADALSAQFATRPEGSAENASASSSGFFTLGANSALRLTCLTSATLSGPSAQGFSLPLGYNLNGPLQFSFGDAFLSVDLIVLSGGSGTAVSSSGSDALFFENHLNPDVGQSADAYSFVGVQQSFEFELLNETAAPLEGFFSALVSAFGQQIAPPAEVNPVPSPASIWLLLAGLGAGLIARRRPAS